MSDVIVVNTPGSTNVVMSDGEADAIVTSTEGTVSTIVIAGIPISVVTTQAGVVSVIESIQLGPQGIQGDPGSGSSSVSCAVVRIAGVISAINFVDGRVINITRDNDGNIVSLSDGTTTKTIVRVGGEITQVIVS